MIYCNMHGMLYFVVSVSMVIMISVVRGDTGSDKYSTCPIKCDLVQEVTLLRQLLNQESLLRISVTNELQQLKKQITRNTQRINVNFQETITSIANVEKLTNTTITNVEESMNAKIIQVGITNNNKLTLVDAAVNRLKTTTNIKLTKVNKDVKRVDTAIASIIYRMIERILRHWRGQWQNWIKRIKVLSYIDVCFTGDNNWDAKFYTWGYRAIHSTFKSVKIWTIRTENIHQLTCHGSLKYEYNFFPYTESQQGTMRNIFWLNLHLKLKRNNKCVSFLSR